MRATDIIARKRDGCELSREELDYFILSYARGEIPDYQVSAWLMAVFFNGMTAQETADLTMAMVASGRRLDLSSVGPFVADKHSTGGVGDKTTLVVAPLVAAAGIPVAKMSGRGLGYSGGTVDKLESIEGFRTQLSAEEFIALARRTHLVVAAQSPELAPADGLLYALRDVTATVESIPLIAASIMSKKIAAGANGVVLDVKLGSGAFMKTREQTRQLATAMRDIGRSVGLQVRAVISSMDQPLGYAVGNALEVAEAVQTLRNEGPADLVEVACTIGGHLAQLAGKVESVESGVGLMEDLLCSSRGLAKFREFIEGQGGDSSFLEDLRRLPQAAVQVEVYAERAGFVGAIDAETVGRASVEIGAGRAVKGEAIDHSVGFVLHKKLGDAVTIGEPLATVYAAGDRQAAVGVRNLASAFTISTERVQPLPVIIEVIE